MSQEGRRGDTAVPRGPGAGPPTAGGGTARRIGRMAGTPAADRRHRAEPASDRSSVRIAVGVFPRFGPGLRATCRSEGNAFDDAEDMMPDRSPDPRPCPGHGRDAGTSRPRGPRAGW